MFDDYIEEVLNERRKAREQIARGMVAIQDQMIREPRPWKREELVTRVANSTALPLDVVGRSVWRLLGNRTLRFSNEATCVTLQKPTEEFSL